MEYLMIIIILIVVIIVLKFLKIINHKIYEFRSNRIIRKNSLKKEKRNEKIEKELNKDINFNIKIEEIKNLIINEKIRDIKEIAQKTNSSLEESVLKIKYLEDKNKIPNIHLNTKTYTLIECSYEDEELLKKYIPFLNSRSYIGYATFRYEEILYLYKKGLIPEIEINEQTKKIIFLDLNKKIENDLITVICNNCGALNDVNRGCKTRCQYCNAEIDDSK